MAQSDISRHDSRAAEFQSDRSDYYRERHWLISHACGGLSRSIELVKMAKVLLDRRMLGVT